MNFKLNKVKIAGKEVWPIVEGGKGIALSNGLTSGSFAREGCIGTISGVFADKYRPDGSIIPYSYKGKTRQERQNELIVQAIEGGICQVKKANEVRGRDENNNKNGLVFLNILWEMGGAIPILEGILDGSKGMIDGVVCGAGMPYKLAEICSKRGIYYNPIVSSARAFKLLWKRDYSKYPEYLGAVVYEDPWLAGGHNGLSNSDNPNQPEKPYERVKEIRQFLNEVGLSDKPIIIAGGVWHLSEWTDYIDNPELGPVLFQFGTRPLVTVESPIKLEMKNKFFTLAKGDVRLQQFSPTGFYSSAINNSFLQRLYMNKQRRIKYSESENFDDLYTYPVALFNGMIGKIAERALRKYSVKKALLEKANNYGIIVYINPNDKELYKQFIYDGFDHILKTPDGYLQFFDANTYKMIMQDRRDCVGCLSGCLFSGWSQRENLKISPNPMNFCIQKALQRAAKTSDVENSLLFSGHIGYRFAVDDFYKGGQFIPTIAQLIEQIKKGY